MACIVGSAVPAEAQHVPFERALQVIGDTILDVSTVRGKITVSVGEPGSVTIAGRATVRTGWDVPANAAHLARTLAGEPPIERVGNTIRLRPPTDDAVRRAVTISYDVTVPPDTRVRSSSQSGATSVTGVTAPVEVRTQSGAIELSRLAGGAEVTSGSGAVTVDGIEGPLGITTSSSAITARDVHAGLRVRTTSGAVEASMAGAGDVDVETGSSAVTLRGVRGGLTASTRSGRVTLAGLPGAPWQVSTGSGSVDVTFAPAARLALEAVTRSGSINAGDGFAADEVSKRRVTGTIGTGGTAVRLTSGSGSIRITVDS